jgi:L-ascorbate metabolism protein UlaG (beta-lactamase superfamily)
LEMTTDENGHTRIRTARNRRAFLGSIGTVGLTLYASKARSGELLAQQVSTAERHAAPEESWKVTLSAPDGAHPPFVSNSRRLLSPPELLDAPDEWVHRSLQWVDFILRTYPPGLVELPPRRPALFRLDEVLHIESAPRKPLVQEFFQLRLQRAIEEIERTTVSAGMRIWRLYNHGALVRTPTASFTFDFVPGIGTEGFALSKEWLERLVAQSDAHFISHKHPDHSNPNVVRLFMEAHKPVVAPERLFPEEPNLSSYLTVLERRLHVEHTVPIRGGNSRLRVVTFPGHQGPSILNNVTLVKTADDLTVVHTGDQSGDEGEGTDFDWITQIGHYHSVDVLLVNGWTNGLHRIIRGVNPRLVIPGHENEMTHAVPHREEYTQDYERMFGLHYHFIVMSWGESYLYTQPAELQGVLPDEE